MYFQNSLFNRVMSFVFPKIENDDQAKKVLKRAIIGFSPLMVFMFAVFSYAGQLSICLVLPTIQFISLRSLWEYRSLKVAIINASITFMFLSAVTPHPTSYSEIVLTLLKVSATWSTFMSIRSAYFFQGLKISLD